MRRRMIGTCGLGLLVAGGAVMARQAPPAGDANWRQWRGPDANGVAPKANPPVKWSETENVKWKVKIPGSGHSSPIVWNDRVFLQTAVPAHSSGAPVPAAPSEVGGGQRRGFGSTPPTGAFRFTLLCLNRKTGKTLWERVVKDSVPHEGHHPDHGFSSFSPVTDGKRVYASFGSRGVYCYDMAGNQKWTKDLGKMQTRNGFGEGSSPALWGNILVVNWDHEGEDFIVALDASTGVEKWRQPREEPTTWATPLIVHHGGTTQVVTSGSNKVRSYDLATGRPLWQCSGLTSNVIPSPVAAGETVYATSGYRGSALLAIKLGQTGDLTGTKAIAWSLNRSTPYVPSPLLYHDRLYFFASNTPTLTVVDIKSGTPVIEAARIEGLQGVYASPVGAADRVYLTGRNGVTVVLKRSDKLDVLATNTLDDRIDASPALAGNDLFLRGREFLYCISETTAR